MTSSGVCVRPVRPWPGPTRHAFDADLLARVREQPIAGRRTVPRAVAVPAAAGLTITAVAVVMLAGGPGDVGGPSSASAVTQALRWLNPPPGTILHARSVETQGGRTTTREFWQSADHPATEREVLSGAQSSETTGDAVYDAATDTIYEPPGGTPDAKPGDASLPPGDPAVAKVRILLQEGRMEVRGREVHNGTDAWAISLKPGVGRPVWTLWVLRRRRQAAGVARSRPRRERAAAGHPLVGLRGAARRRRRPGPDAHGRPPVGPRGARVRTAQRRLLP